MQMELLQVTAGQPANNNVSYMVVAGGAGGGMDHVRWWRWSRRI